MTQSEKRMEQITIIAMHKHNLRLLEIRQEVITNYTMNKDLIMESRLNAEQIPILKQEIDIKEKELNSVY